jgi:hypothetical protein
MALQGKITTKRGFQSAGASQKVIVARNIGLTSGQKLADLTDVDTTLRDDGSLIQWDQISSTFKIKGVVENPKVSIVGGSF